MSKKCDVCNSKIGLLDGIKISNGSICPNCAILCSSYKTETIENMKKYYELNNQRKALFSETQKLKTFLSTAIHIDNVHNLFYIEPHKITNYFIYSFDEVIDYSYNEIEETRTTTTKTKGGITRAVIGGSVAGPVGAVVGSSTAKTVSQTTPGLKVLYFNVTTYSGIKKVPVSSPPIGFTEFLDKCINNKKSISNTYQDTTTNEIEQLTKYKELLDKGIITEEEFSLKKKQILNI